MNEGALEVRTRVMEGGREEPPLFLSVLQWEKRLVHHSALTQQTLTHTRARFRS